jgi:hypothetical protein
MGADGSHRDNDGRELRCVRDRPAVDGWTYGTPNDGQGMVLVVHVFWTDAHGNSFGGTTPTCMTPGSSGQRVEVRLTHRGGPIDWVHCLS